MTKARLGSMVAGVAALTLLALGSPALAKDGDVLVGGSCSGGSAVKLKLSGENGRIEAGVEVDQNRNGIAWTVVLTRDGERVARATRRTRGPSGSFELRRLLADPAGADVVRAVATRPGERCTVRATWNG